ncbi:MAG: GIY-YIG nuclease family protein, partial [Cohnella sp.]|nr:GIY-YIG nuclease family protein [Cohnella sp.]
SFSKQMNTNTFMELKEDWGRYGGNAFVFEVLDTIRPREEQLNDPSELLPYKDEVETLLDLWLEKLQPYGERGYNKPKRK